MALQALKRAEAGDRWIARFRELSGTKADTVSFRLPDSPRTVEQVNGMEEQNLGPVNYIGGSGFPGREKG